MSFRVCSLTRAHIKLVCSLGTKHTRSPSTWASVPCLHPPIQRKCLSNSIDFAKFGKPDLVASSVGVSASSTQWHNCLKSLCRILQTFFWQSICCILWYSANRSSTRSPGHATTHDLLAVHVLIPEDIWFSASELYPLNIKLISIAININYYLKTSLSGRTSLLPYPTLQKLRITKIIFSYIYTIYVAYAIRLPVALISHQAC